MKVRDLLQTKGSGIVSIESDHMVEDAIRTMDSRKIAAIIVTEDGRPVGIFTERDVLRSYIAAGGKSFREIPVREVMTTNLIVAEMDDEISNIMSVMVDRNIRHLPVVDKGKVTGMLSIRDIIQTQVGKLTAELHYLKDYITGA